MDAKERKGDRKCADNPSTQTRKESRACCKIPILLELLSHAMKTAVYYLIIPQDMCCMSSTVPRKTKENWEEFGPCK